MYSLPARHLTPSGRPHFRSSSSVSFLFFALRERRRACGRAGGRAGGRGSESDEMLGQKILGRPGCLVERIKTEWNYPARTNTTWYCTSMPCIHLVRGLFFLLPATTPVWSPRRYRGCANTVERSPSPNQTEPHRDHIKTTAQHEQNPFQNKTS